MGYWKVILLENNIFELSLEGSRELRITERGRKLTNWWVLRFSLVRRVVQTLEDSVHLETSREFIRTSNIGNSAFIAQSSSNTHGLFLTIVE